MDIEELREYCLSKAGVTEKTPFGKFARRYESILVFYIFDHMFCLVDMDDFAYVTVKATAEEVAEIWLGRSSVSRPLNLDARFWVQLDFGGDISESEVFGRIDRSYDIVRARYAPKRKQQ